MKKIFILLFIIAFKSALGIDLKVEYIPKEPRAGEAIQINFIISGSDLEEFEDISFTPDGFDILDKDSRSTSSRTTYVNGKLTREITQKIEYNSFIPEKTKRIHIRDIVLKTKKGNIDYSDISLNVKKSLGRNRDVFIKAVLERENLYKGEGTLLSYYLYSKSPVSSIEIKKFPVLKGFLKRFQNIERHYTNRVTFRGQEYNRTYIYSAYVFPQKSGYLEIDPITISTHVQNDKRGGSRFNVFGFSISTGFNQVKKVLRSEPLRLRVRDLPLPIPEGFSGLVGQRHDFQFSINKDKFLANEPIEVSLKVTSDGELEGFDSPDLFSEKIFEKFDSTGKLTLGKKLEGQKDFSYTYLAKTSGTYPERKVSFVVFNPQKKSYENHMITIPQLKVAAGASLPVSGKGGSYSKGEGVVDANTPYSLAEEAFKPSTGVSSPYFSYSLFLGSWIEKTLYLLMGIFIGLIGFVSVKGWSRKPKNSFQEALEKIKRKNWNYPDLYSFVGYLRPRGDNRSISDIIKMSQLSKKAKKYYLDMLNALGAKEFSDGKVRVRYRIRKEYIEEVVKIVEKDENL